MMWQCRHPAKLWIIFYMPILIATKLFIVATSASFQSSPSMGAQARPCSSSGLARYQSIGSGLPTNAPSLSGHGSDVRAY